MSSSPPSSLQSGGARPEHAAGAEPIPVARGSAGPGLLDGEARGGEAAGAGVTPARRGRRLVRVGLLVLALASLGLAGGAGALYLRADYHVRQATTALEKQRYAQALESYERALSYRPDSARLHLLAARTARQAGQIAKARDHLRRCRELQGGPSEEQQVEEYLVRAQTGEMDQVQVFLVPYLLKEGPLTPLVLEAFARGYMANYRMDLAWGCLYRWLEIQPDNVEALFRRATWWAQQQNYKAASADYRRALELDPDRIDARLAYAEMLRAEKAFAEVVEQYQAVLSRSPQHPAALVGLAQACVELGRLPEALRALDRVPPDRQGDADVYWLRGLIEMRQGRHASAEPLLRHALELDPRHMDACYNLMLCLNTLGRAGEACKARDQLAQIEHDQKRLIGITTRELIASPSNPDLYCELGEIYLRFRLPDRALYWLNGALRLNPRHWRSHEALRDYFDSLGPAGREQADAHRKFLASPR